MRLLWIYLDIESGCPAHYNHGVGDLDAILRQEGRETSLIYLKSMPGREEFLAAIDDQDPDVVLFPINTHQWAFGRTLADWVKEHRPTLPTVFGGIHAILIPDQVINHQSVDFVCIGEGERPLQGLCRRLDGGEDPHGVEGIWSKRGGDVIRTEMPCLIEDLDSLPISDRSIWDMDWILKENYREITVMGGRGCPFTCTYCANSARMKRYRGKGRYVRMSSPERFIDIIAILAGCYSFRSIFFEDDVFTMDHDWTRKFCGLYKERFNFPFTCYARVEMVSREILQTLKDAGCEMIAVGVEAGSERLRAEALNRRMRNEDIIRVFKWADDLGLKTWNFNMVGIPGETPQTIQELFDLNEIIRPDKAQISIFYPYPETRLYDVCRSEGLLVKEEQSTYFHSSILDLPTVSQEEIESAFWRFRAMAARIQAEKEARGVYDFLANLENAEVWSESPEPIERRRFNIEGDLRLVLFAHPRTEIAFQVDVPIGAEFCASVALDPLCLKWGGEGVLFALLCQVGDGRRELWSRYIDPKHFDHDMGWQEVRVPLSDLWGKRAKLILKTETAPSGDLTGAWSGWARPHIAKVEAR